VLAVGLAGAVDCGDVRVRELRRKPRLPVEARHTFWIRSEFCREDLQRDVSAQLLVMRKVYLPHGPRAEAFEHGVVGEPPASIDVDVDSTSDRYSTAFPVAAPGLSRQRVFGGRWIGYRDQIVVPRVDGPEARSRTDLGKPLGSPVLPATRKLPPEAGFEPARALAPEDSKHGVW